MTRTFVDEEIASQPETWSQAAELALVVRDALPAAGERVAFVGCGTSWFVGMAVAVHREARGLGESDAFAASEFPLGRSYDRVVAISRSGTTTEILELLGAVAGPTTLITAVPDSPASALADTTIALPFADEQSVVQTRFATSVIALLRAHAGEDLTGAAADAQAALSIDVDRYASVEQCTFVATGWAVGLTYEAALKTREAAQFWAESYPAMEFRHGPISVVGGSSTVWVFGPPPARLLEDLQVTGAHVENSDLDPMADLIRAQRLAVALAETKGLNPDEPRHLTRSVVLS